MRRQWSGSSERRGVRGWSVWTPCAFEGGLWGSTSKISGGGMRQGADTCTVDVMASQSAPCHALTAPCRVFVAGKRLRSSGDSRTPTSSSSVGPAASTWAARRRRPAAEAEGASTTAARLRMRIAAAAPAAFW